MKDGEIQNPEDKDKDQVNIVNMIKEFEPEPEHSKNGIECEREGKELNLNIVTQFEETNQRHCESDSSSKLSLKSLSSTALNNVVDKSDRDTVTSVNKKPLIKSKKSPCDICGKMVLYPEHHFKTKHNDKHNVNKTQCPECGKSVQHIISHLRWKHNHGSKKYQCSECLYVSQSPTNVKLHFQNMHQVDEKRKKFPCDQCEKVLATVSSRNTHIKRKHENQKQTCHICQKQFISGLRKHIQKIHEGRRFPCEYCGHQSTETSSLRMHIEAKHKGIKHACDQCGKSFSQLGTLNLHIKTKHIN